MDDFSLLEYGMIKGGVILVDDSTSARKFYIKKWDKEKVLTTKKRALELISAFENQWKNSKKK